MRYGESQSRPSRTAFGDTYGRQLAIDVVDEQSAELCKVLGLCLISMCVVQGGCAP